MEEKKHKKKKKKSVLVKMIRVKALSCIARLVTMLLKAAVIYYLLHKLNTKTATYKEITKTTTKEGRLPGQLPV